MTFRPTFQISRVLNLYVSNPVKLFSYYQQNGPNFKNYAHLNRRILDTQPIRKYAASRRVQKTQSNLKCNEKKPKKGPECKKYSVEGCKPARTSCDRLADPKCKKTEAPYKSFGDVFDGWYEPYPTECVDNTTVHLQPKDMKSAKIIVQKAPPPKVKQVDPELERKCLERERGKKESEWKPNEAPFVNPCPHCTVPPCKPRARQSCELLDMPSCTKVEAPYESFTDKCPQFPDLQLNECEMAEILANKARQEFEDKEKQKQSKTSGVNEEQTKPISTSSKQTEKKDSKEQDVLKKSKDSTKYPVPICVSTKDALKLANSTTTTSTTATASKSEPVKTKCKEELKTQVITKKSAGACGCPTASLSLWDKICAYFRARPNCPAPDDWKKEKLRRKAEKAAAAAGLKLCEVDACKSKKSTITISQSTNVEDPCQTAKKSKSDKKASSKDGTNFISPCCANIKSSSSSSKHAGTSKKYSTFLSGRREYSTYALTRCRHNINNSNKHMFENLLDNNLLKYSNILDNDVRACSSHCCNDNYVGKIYQIRLTKSKNSLVTKGIDEDVYTTCYTCKFVPKSQIINSQKKKTAMQSVRFKRKTNRTMKMNN